ncbi:endolysin [Vibrio phage K460]
MSNIAYFFSADGNTKVMLDGTKRVRISAPSSVSQSSNSAGQAISHTSVEGNTTISVEGKVTYSKSVSQQDNLNPYDFQRELQKARRNRQKFTLYLTTESNPLLQDYKNCVIQNVDVEVGEFLDTIEVSLVFEQVFVTAAAEATTIKMSPTDQAKLDGVGSPDGSGSRGTKTKADEKQATTMFYRDANAISGFAGGSTDISIFGNEGLEN